jgi:hypothetical protein
LPAVACKRRPAPSFRLVCRSQRNGALSRPAEFSVSTQRHGCHPFTATLAGSIFKHVFPLPVSATTYLTYVAPSLPAWSSKRERCCCMSAASSPERRARGPRVGRASRSPCTEVSISSSANGRRISAAGY